MPKHWRGTLLLLLSVTLTPQEQPKAGWKKVGEEKFAAECDRVQILVASLWKVAV